MQGYIKFILFRLLQLNRSHSTGPLGMLKDMTFLLFSLFLIMIMGLHFTRIDATSEIPSNATYCPTLNCGHIFNNDHPFWQQNQELEHWTGELVPYETETSIFLITR